MALRCDDEVYDRAARFWIRIFAITFLMGVVTLTGLFGMRYFVSRDGGSNELRAFLASCGYIVGMLLVTGYFVFTYRTFAGKVDVEESAGY